MVTTRRVVLLSLAVAWSLSASPGQAQDAEKAFYAGKTVRMIVGSGVGGGYDVFSRLIAPYLAKTLGTTVIVENQPGAGGLIALNKLYVAAARRAADFARSRHHGRGLRAAHRAIRRALRPDQVQLPRDRRRAARPVAGRAGLADPRGPAGDRRQDEMALGVRGRNVRTRHRRGLHLRGAQARLPRRAGLQGQRRRRPCGHARRDGCALRAGIVRQQFREGQAELGAGDDLAHQVAVLPGPADVFEAAKIDPDRIWAMDFLANRRRNSAAS